MNAVSRGGCHRYHRIIAGEVRLHDHEQREHRQQREPDHASDDFADATF
jgi:hypothetical protein